MKLGNVAYGDHFHGRKQEIADFWRLLVNENIVFSGPRRLGKSSLLERLHDTAGEHGMLAVRIDVGGCEGVRSFIEALNSALPKELTDKLLRGFGRLAAIYAAFKFGADGGKSVERLVQGTDTWQPAAQSLRQRLDPLTLVIMLDEFSVFLDKGLNTESEDIINLLDWLRAWRQSRDVKCRFIFTGSISLNSVLENNGLSSRFNDCYDYRLHPFKIEEAHILLLEEARRLNWQIDEGVSQYLCDKLGWLSPYFLNLLLDEAVKAGVARLEGNRVQARQLQQDDIDLGYERVVSVGSRFDQWYQRLIDMKDANMALAVLAAVACSRTGTLIRGGLRARLHKLDADPTRRSRRLDSILMVLSEEGYLIQNEDSVQFLSPLLRDYWRRNHA